MERSEQSEYANIPAKLQPAQAVDVLNDRVRQVGRLNTAIADWLQERRRLEEQYANGLRRLARQNLDENDLGIFSVPWGTILSSMDTLADSHSALASKIDTDVERPLRDFAHNDRQMTAMSTMQGNIASLAKDVDKAQQKTEKLQSKGGNSTKVEHADSDLDNARAQWDSQAPYVFETLQSLDESRVNQLQDHLTQFQTLEVDQVEKNRVAAEQCLNMLLNVETQDEIKTFALKALSAKPAPRARPTSMMPAALTGSRGAASSSTNLAPIQSNNEEDSPRSNSVQEKEKKGPMKSLRRLGTVMRRKDKQPASTLPSMAESPERKPRSSPFNSFGRMGRSKDSYTLEPPQEESPSQRPRSPLRMGSEVLEPTTSRQEAPSTSRASRLEPVPQLNGDISGASASASTSAPRIFANGSHQGDLADLEPPKPSQSMAPQIPSIAEPSRDSDGFSVPPPDLDPISQAHADAASALEGQPPQFNVNIRNAPIEEEVGPATLASMATQLQAPPVVSRRAGTVRGRRNDRNSYIPPQQFSNPNPSPALPSPFAMAAPSASPQAPPAQPPPFLSTASPSQTSPRGFESPATSSTGALGAAAGAGAGAAGPSSASVPQSPVGQSPGLFGAAAGTTGAVGAVGAAGGVGAAASDPSPDPQSPVGQTSKAAMPTDAGDNRSVRSGKSLSSNTAAQGLKHPDLTEPGLNSSIIETISARFEDGKLATSSLIGEIALAHNAQSSSAVFGQDIIRLDGFSTLEKVAPNPALLHQTPLKEGEYSVNLSNISKPQIAFKYQLRHDAADVHMPLLLAPVLRIEPKQTSIIVHYSLNPGFALQGRTSLTLHNVMLALTLDGAKASSCLSKPVGTFSRERNLIFWQLNDLTLTPGAAPEKLLARFATDGEAKGGSVEAKWEVSGEHALGLGSGIAVSALSHGGGAADPFADESAATAWKVVPGVKRLVSGSYVARA